MSNRRFRIMAGTAMALILAAPLVSMAKNVVTPMRPCRTTSCGWKFPTPASPRRAARDHFDGPGNQGDGERRAGDRRGRSLAGRTRRPHRDRRRCDRERCDCRYGNRGRAGAARTRSAGIARSRRPPRCGEHPRPLRRQGGQVVRRFERARRGRGVLQWTQLRAAVDREGSSRPRVPRRSSRVSNRPMPTASTPSDYRTPSFAGPGPDALAEADVRSRAPSSPLRVTCRPVAFHTTASAATSSCRKRRPRPRTF